MKQSLRRVHPLCWFVLIWLLGNWVSYWIQPYRQPVGLYVICTGIVGIHLAIYWIGFTIKMRRSFSWLLLLVQAGCVLLLTHVSQDEMVAFTFFLVLIVATIEILRQVRAILLATSGYLVLLLLYMYTLGSSMRWLYLWRGDNAASEILVVLVLAGMVIYLQQKRAHEWTQALLHDLNVAHVQLSAYALRVEELTMLTERQRLARELHDTLSQGMAGLVMQLEAANSYLISGRSTQAHGIVVSAITRARTILTESRYVLHDLRADRPRADDLPEVVQEEIDRFTSDTGISCDAELEALSTMPDAYCGHVLRAIAEGLTNVACHAQAHQVWVHALARGQMLDIEIRDDGVGFDPVMAVSFPGHYGLLGMRERVHLIGGQLDIVSSPGKGTSIHVGIPTQSDARSCV